ncbi:MAG TPA: hypothetical protein VKD22_07905 [Ramlibacter sp.]|nr:hypothetical protein [Ramlibacter sp.]
MKLSCSSKCGAAEAELLGRLRRVLKYVAVFAEADPHFSEVEVKHTDDPSEVTVYFDDGLRVLFVYDTDVHALVYTEDRERIPMPPPAGLAKIPCSEEGGAQFVATVGQLYEAVSAARAAAATSE